MTRGSEMTADHEGVLRARLHAIAAHVPVTAPPNLTVPERRPMTAAPPLPIADRRAVAPRLPVRVLAVAAAVALIAAVGAVVADRTSDRPTVDAAGRTDSDPTAVDPTRASEEPAPPRPCSDDRGDGVLGDGTDSRGHWTARVVGTPPIVAYEVTYDDGGSGSMKHSAESWDRLVNQGVFGGLGSDPTDSDGRPTGEEVHIQEVPRAVVAVRLRYPDGHVTELCTVGHRLGLPVALVVFATTPSAKPVVLSGVDATGLELVRADYTIPDVPGVFRNGVIEIVDGRVALPLQATP